MATVSLKKEPKQRKELRRRPFYVYTLVIVIVAFTAMLATSILYTNYAQRKNDREWCELFQFYSGYYASNPPQSPLQKEQAELMRKREQALDCK